MILSSGEATSSLRATRTPIGTFCTERRYAPLHSDRDFDPVERHPGLAVIHV